MPKRPRKTGPRAATAGEMLWAAEAFKKADAFDRLAVKARNENAHDWAFRFGKKADRYRWYAAQAKQGLGIPSIDWSADSE